VARNLEPQTPTNLEHLHLCDEKNQGKMSLWLTAQIRVILSEKATAHQSDSLHRPLPNDTLPDICGGIACAAQM
jgi:hypothetical protein